MGLRTNSITIRDESFTVSEMSAKVFQTSRKMNASEEHKHRADLFIAAACCVEPKFTEDELSEMALEYTSKLAAEAIRLTWPDAGKKKATAEKNA